MPTIELPRHDADILLEAAFRLREEQEAGVLEIDDASLAALRASCQRVHRLLWPGVSISHLMEQEDAQDD